MQLQTDVASLVIYLYFLGSLTYEPVIFIR